MTHWLTDCKSDSHWVLINYINLRGNNKTEKSAELHLLRNSEMSFIFSKSHKNISYWNNVKIKEGLYYSAWSRPLKGFDIFFIFVSFFRKKKYIYIMSHPHAHKRTLPRSCLWQYSPPTVTQCKVLLPWVLSKGDEWLNYRKEHAVSYLHCRDCPMVRNSHILVVYTYTSHSLLIIHLHLFIYLS